MTESETKGQAHAGGCLCGAVRFTVAEAPVLFHVCHCDMCRRWSGGPSLSVHVTGGVIFEGEANVTVYRSSDWAERGFCTICGANLFYRLVDSEEHMLSVGVLDDQAPFVMEEQCFIDEKPPGYSFANDVPLLTAAEVYARFAGGDPPD